eukprot:6241975-Prymnesium_polylepis.1
MRYTERRGAAMQALGGGGMIDWDRENAVDVTLDQMFEKVLGSVVSDDGGAKHAIGIEPQTARGVLPPERGFDPYQWQDECGEPP